MVKLKNYFGWQKWHNSFNILFPIRNYWAVFQKYLWVDICLKLSKLSKWTADILRNLGCGADNRDSNNEMLWLLQFQIVIFDVKTQQNMWPSCYFKCFKIWLIYICSDSYLYLLYIYRCVPHRENFVIGRSSVNFSRKYVWRQW